jgi:hypothetical protein
MSKSKAKTAEAHDELLLNQKQDRQTVVNSAPMSANGRAHFQKSVLRNGDNRTADGAPTAAGVHNPGFKGQK